MSATAPIVDHPPTMPISLVAPVNLGAPLASGRAQAPARLRRDLRTFDPLPPDR